MGDFAEKVRNWMHFDNLIASFNKQVQQARSAKTRWESEIITYLESSNLRNAIVQISGIRLTLAQEKHAQPITNKVLKTLLSNYFKSRNKPDETDEILSFIQANRGHVVKTCLKKN